MRDIAERFTVSRNILACDFFGKVRTRDVAHARQDCMATLAENGLCISEIGRIFNRDHTTVSHGIKAHKARRA
jgi:chromosomal replication initiation ATPase DnaA